MKTTRNPQSRFDDPLSDVAASAALLVTAFGGVCAVLIGSVAGALGA